MTRIATALIRCYQRTLSPDHGWFRAQHPLGFCRYAPTCSQYAVAAMEQFGFFRGAALATWRILRCNPFARGGIDPVSVHDEGTRAGEASSPPAGHGDQATPHRHLP